jgi:hypothetical protein
MWIGCIWLRLGLAGSWEYGNELSGSMKNGEFFD